jgi:Fe-S cluster assembly protein SufD
LADVASGAPLGPTIPTFKGRPGWEFTDTSALDVEAYQLSTVHPAWGSDAPGALWELPMEQLPAGVDVSVDGDTTIVTVARGVVVEDPIAFTVLVPDGQLASLRMRVVLEEGAQAAVWEQYVSAGDCVLNVATELEVGANARLRYVCGQGLSEDAWIFGAQRAVIGRDAALDWVALGFGSRSGHVLMETRLAGEGAEARVTGAYATHRHHAGARGPEHHL